MRLIDADLLEPDAEYDDGEFWAVSMRQIENAPTIEPKTETKTPRWVAEDRFVKGHYFEYPHCPKCNCELIIGQSYCSICGQHITWDEEEGKTEC